MQINIEKRHAILIFIGLALLAGSFYVYAVDTSQPWHSSNQIDFSDGMTVDGPITAKGNVSINGTGGQFLYLNSEADIIKYISANESEGEIRYCKDTGEDCFINQCEIVISPYKSWGKGYVATNTINCPTGKKLVGGGCDCYAYSSFYNILVKSFPKNDNTWQCSCYNNVNGPVNVYAICCPA